MRAPPGWQLWFLENSTLLPRGGLSISIRQQSTKDVGEASVFIATSLDGFIARSDGTLDWLPEGGGEPHGYTEFMATVDALVIGRKTFETVLSFPEWPYGTKPVIVLSSSPATLKAPPGAMCTFM